MANDKSATPAGGSNAGNMQNRGTSTAAGQQKPHTVRNAQTGEERQITQEQWRNRSSDPSLAGFERVDDAAEVPESPAPSSGGQTSGQ